jgi:hypothetical protein
MTIATGEATIYASSHLTRTVMMEDFDSVAVTKTCNGIYHAIFNGFGLMASSAVSRYHICVDLENGHDYLTSIRDTYEFKCRKLWDLREVIDSGLGKPWIWEVVNRAVSYRKQSPANNATFLDEAKSKLLAFEGLYRQLWENLACPESLRSHEEKINEDRRIWREFDQDRKFGEVSVGLQEELAAIKRVITEQGSDLAALADSAKPFDWSTVVQGAIEQQEREGNERKAFQESQELSRKWYTFNNAVMDWRNTWDNAMYFRNGRQITEFEPVKELTRSLNELLAGIETVGYSKNLVKVEPLFNPAVYEERDARVDAFALKAVLQFLVAIKNGHEARQLITGLWSMESPSCCRTDFALKDILRLADHWPLNCRLCSKQLEPRRFGKGTCGTCSEAKRLNEQTGTLEQTIAPGKSVASATKKPKSDILETDTYGLFRAELLRHHGFGTKSLNFVPTTPTKLANTIGKSGPTWTRCFKLWMNTEKSAHRKYCSICERQDSKALERELKRLHGSVSVEQLVQSALELISSDDSGFIIS